MVNYLYYSFVLSIVLRLIASYDPEDELKYVTNSLTKTNFDPNANSKIVDGDTQYVVLIPTSTGGLTIDSIAYSTVIYNITSLVQSKDLLIKLKGNLMTASRGEMNDTNMYVANFDVKK